MVPVASTGRTAERAARPIPYDADRLQGDRGFRMWPGSGPPRVPPSAARRRRDAARPDDDSGAVAIMVALLTTVFVGLAALVVDHGLSADTQRRAQNAADASALAAAVVLARGGLPAKADEAARAYALAN